MKKSNSFKPLPALTGFAALALASSLAGAEPEAASPYRNLGIFARALAHIEASYVEQVDQDKLIYGAIRGMLKALDPHSAFMDPEEFRILSSDEAGRYGGIGVEIDVQDGWLTVIGVYSGGPAARAGIRVGDRFLSIDGRLARDLAVDEAVRGMRGEPGTKVEVTLRRLGQEDTLRLSLTREIIHIDAVEARLLPDRSVYLRLRAFNEDTVPAFRKVLNEAVDRASPSGGVSGLLMDLRDNPGGLLDAAVLIADEFLEQGVIVSTYGRGQVKLREWRAKAAGTRPDWPLVALINGYSASAAEIVAGALRDHGRAVVVGTRSFGKGSVQNVIMLPDGSAMKLTTARYYTPSGRSIQAEGIEPDVVVEQIDAAALRSSEAGRDQIRETSLERHLIPDNQKGAPRSASSAARPRGEIKAPDTLSSDYFADDYQCRVAHQILQTLIAKRR